MKLPVRSRRAEYENMTRGELIDALCAQDRLPTAENVRLLRELEAHQIEFEMQNRQLQDSRDELDDARHRYLDLFEVAPVAYCIFDRNGNIEDANAMTATFLRTNRAALVGIPFSRAVSIVEKQTFVDHIARCLDEQVRVTSELTVIVRGRGELVLQAVSTPLVNGAGRVTSCRTMLHDVTRLKRSESVLRFVASVDELLASAVDTRSVLEAMATACVPTLADACFVDLCVEGEEDAPMRRVEIHAPDRSVAAEALKRHAFDAAWRRYEAQLARTLTPVFEPTSAAALGPGVEAQIGAHALLLVPLATRGRTLGVFGTMMMQSGRTYALHDFELAQNLARRFATALANAVDHDHSRRLVRERDQALSVVSEELARRLDEIIAGAGALDGGEPAEAVRRSAERMGRVVRNLLDVARLDTGRLSLERKAEDVSDLVSAAVAAATPAAVERNVAIERDASPGLVAACDRRCIVEVLDRLVRDAVHVTPSGGTVRVHAERNGTVIRTVVTDGGPPIADELLQSAFDPTWQAKVEGTAREVVGLGAYVTKGVVEAHGGTVGVSSGAAGASFFFTLPAHGARPAEAMLPIPIPPPSVPRPAIFIVDLDTESRRVIRDELQRHGYAVIEMDDLGAATGQVRSASSLPAALIVDETSLEVASHRLALEAIRSDPALAPMPLILTGRKERAAFYAAGLGASLLLEKPVALERLLATLDE